MYYIIFIIFPVSLIMSFPSLVLFTCAFYFLSILPDLFLFSQRTIFLVLFGSLCWIFVGVFSPHWFWVSKCLTTLGNIIYFIFASLSDVSFYIKDVILVICCKHFTLVCRLPFNLMLVVIFYVQKLFYFYIFKLISSFIISYFGLMF